MAVLISVRWPNSYSRSTLPCEELRQRRSQSSYPYTAITGKKCLFKPEDVGATLQSYKTIPAGKENDLQTAVATVGPVSVAIDASNPSFHFYKKGIYYEPDCSSTR